MTDHRRILVIDDDPASCDLVAYFLKSLGYEVAIAFDGNRALNMNLNDHIELVIMDVHLPVYTGAEVVTLLRKRHLLRPVKVLVVTGDGSPEAREAMDRVGVDGFLTKPVHLGDLRAEVERLVPGLSQNEGALHRRARERRLGLVTSEL